MKKLFAKTERSEEPQTPFKYERLRSTKTKLLRLQRNSLTKLPSRRLNIIHLSDYDGSISTQVEALSYFWGDDAVDRAMSLNNTTYLTFSIKANLESALRELAAAVPVLG